MAPSLLELESHFSSIISIKFYALLCPWIIIIILVLFISTEGCYVSDFETCMMAYLSRYLFEEMSFVTKKRKLFLFKFRIRGIEICKKTAFEHLGFLLPPF